MTKNWYAVQHGDDYASDYGSTVKREAMRMAKAMCKEYPNEEIRIAVCTTDSDYCQEEIIIQAAN